MVAPCVGKVPGTGLEVSLLTTKQSQQWCGSADWRVLRFDQWGSWGHITAIYVLFPPWPWWQCPTCVAGFPSWGSCVMFWQGWLMLGLAGNSHFPVWRQGDRLVIYSYFWYSCAERDSSLHMETCSFSPGMGAEFALWHSWCSSTFPSLLCLIAACLTWGDLL